MYSYRYLLMLDVKRCLLTAVMLVIGIPCVTMEIRYRWAWDYVLIAVPLLLFLVSVFFYYVRRLVLFAVDFISGEQNERMCYKKTRVVKNKAAALYGNKAAMPFPNIYDYQEEDWLYSEIILESEGKKEAIKFRCVTSGPELVKYDRKKVATVYYFKRSRIIEKIVFDESQ